MSPGLHCGVQHVVSVWKDVLQLQIYQLVLELLAMFNRREYEKMGVATAKKSNFPFKSKRKILKLFIK